VTNVSVLTPSYGYGRFIADGIESVIRQEGLHLQHIVQDAGSNDETLEVLRSFGDRVEWTSEPDLGQSDGLNKALVKAAGDWVAWLNADEYYLPDGLRVLVEEGEKLGADVVYGDSIAIDRDSKMLNLRPQHRFSPLILRLYGPFLDSVSMIVRRSILDEAPWDTSLRVVMDWDLYLDLASKGASFHYVPYPVGAFRQHPDQMSAQPGAPETTVVRGRHRIPSARWPRKVGRALHRIRKLATGSYRRQRRAKPFWGHDLRWFDNEDSAETFQALLDRCYGPHGRVTE
jgi:cellulose synthase/poly-beta-1,6-N-acetylglucosamine synthase-like glycosyltransferase